MKTSRRFGWLDALSPYSRLRSQFGQDAFRSGRFSRSLDRKLQQQPGSTGTFLLRWVGREGREIKTPPADAEMAKTIEAFAATSDRSPKAELRIIDGQQILRTIYPSLASELSCVNCHNQLQGKPTAWQLNDVMGAFAIDIPIGSFMQAIERQSRTIGIACFGAAAIGLTSQSCNFIMNKAGSGDTTISDAKRRSSRR